MSRWTAIILALAIALANTFCACALARSAPPAEPVKSCHATQSKKPCHSNERDSRECSHCSGVMSISAPAPKSTSSTATIVPVLLMLPAEHEPFALVTASTDRLHHTGLSPPPLRAAITLLALACASNT
jgi:hypothetical protein